MTFVTKKRKTEVALKTRGRKEGSPLSRPTPKGKQLNLGRHFNNIFPCSQRSRQSLILVNGMLNSLRENSSQTDPYSMDTSAQLHDIVDVIRGEAKLFKGIALQKIQNLEDQLQKEMEEKNNLKKELEENRKELEQLYYVIEKQVLSMSNSVTN